MLEKTVELSIGIRVQTLAFAVFEVFSTFSNVVAGDEDDFQSQYT